eukprot:352277-Chlamydomonas_euryale.AAC.5
MACMVSLLSSSRPAARVRKVCIPPPRSVPGPLRTRVAIYVVVRLVHALGNAAATMDAGDLVVKPLRDFAKSSARLVKRCTKPDRKGEWYALVLRKCF